jgi:hypothetical protein
MSDITANIVVSMPSQLFTLARSFKAASNGSIYIGQIDTDPTIPSNQIQVYLQNEDGSTVPVPQPLSINMGGYPVYNGQIAKFVTVQGHSMAVYDAYGVQQFYYPNVLKYDPDQLRQELASSSGASLVGMPQGGTLAQNLVTVSVDAFGADPTGATDSSPAVIAALQSVYGTTLDSKYYASRTKYAQILFGNGTYMLGDIPLIGGTDYVGQGRWATRIIPKAGASYIFKTVGTLPAGDGGGGARYFNGSIREMLLGDRYLSTGLAANVGGINIMNGSYFRLYNVDVLRLSGPGVWFDGLWDSQFFGLRIMYCGQSASSPGLHIGYTTTSGGVKEGSNGLQFYGLHIELCAQLLAFDYVAHVLISGCKLEGGPDSVISSRIDSPVEVCFADAQLTWQKIAYPMFNMVPGPPLAMVGPQL